MRVRHTWLDRYAVERQAPSGRWRVVGRPYDQRMTAQAEMARLMRRDHPDHHHNHHLDDLDMGFNLYTEAHDAYHDGRLAQDELRT